MGKDTLIDKMRDFISSICFKIFLRCNRMTQDQYFSYVYEDEQDKQKKELIEKLEKDGKHEY